MPFREKNIGRPVTDRKTRRLRVKIAFDQSEKVSDWPETHPPEAAMLRNAMTVNPRRFFGRLPDVGKCIYCGATEYEKGGTRPLSREHVVPEGIGGTLELPGACCQKHEGITSSIEGSILRHLLLAVRRRKELHGKKRKRDGVTVTFTSLMGGIETEIHPELEDHPTVLVLPRLHPPGVIFPEPGFGGIFAHPLVPSQTWIERGVGPFVAADLDMFRFCQLLAKIAHAYASTLVDVNLFNPTLRDLIDLKPSALRDMAEQCYQFVGGFYGMFAPSANLHELDIAFNEQGGVIQILVYIRLFGNLAAPVYVVAVGTLTAGTTVQEVWEQMQSRRAILERTS
jgi:hypothetical protein